METNEITPTPVLRKKKIAFKVRAGKPETIKPSEIKAQPTGKASDKKHPSVKESFKMLKERWACPVWYGLSKAYQDRNLQRNQGKRKPQQEGKEKPLACLEKILQFKELPEGDYQRNPPVRSGRKASRKDLRRAQGTSKKQIERNTEKDKREQK